MLGYVQAATDSVTECEPTSVLFASLCLDMCKPLHLRLRAKRERVDDFICGHNGIGVVWDIDVERGVHLVIRIAGGRVLHHRDIVTKLSGITNRGLQTGVCDESHHDELMDAVFLELHIQIRVGEATGPPMLQGHDIARLRCELTADLATPRAEFEGLSRPRCLLNRRNA